MSEYRIQSGQRARQREPGARVVLTRAEMNVVRCVLDGHTENNEVAAQLALSPRTVGKHIERIRQKVGAKNKAELILMAVGRLQCKINLTGQLARATQSEGELSGD